MTVREELWSNPTLRTRTNHELLVPVARSGGVPLAQQVEARLRELDPGTALPPTRRLAQDIGVSRGVVVRAYAQLRHEGLLEARVGAGSRRVGGAAVTGAPGGARSVTPDRPARPRWRLDLHPEVTDLAAFPRRAWLRAYGEAVNGMPDHALGYEEPTGQAELRAQLAAYLTRARGVRCEAGQVIVCGGLLSAFAIVQRALAETGVRRLHRPRVSHRALASAARDGTPGIAAGWLDIDAGGVVVDGLPRGPHQAVLVEPADAYPLGVPLAPERALALADWARRADAVVVESDVNAELRHDGAGAPAFQRGLPEHTVLIGSTSRALAPGLRVGWIVAPPRLVDAIKAARRATEPSQPVLEQLALARLMACGDLDRHLHRLRERYRARARRLTALLAEELPGWRVHATDGGFHLLAGLPDGGAQERPVVAAAARERVRVVGLAGHVLHGPPLPPALVLGYGALPEAAMPQAVRALERAAGAR